MSLHRCSTHSTPHTGVVLYVMLAGCLPFEEPDLATLFRRISRAQYDMPPWFSTEQRQLLGKMLVIDPEERCVLIVFTASTALTV